jgi:hypothetical protein
LACGSVGPDRGHRTGPAPAPPWVTNKSEPAEAERTARRAPVPVVIWAPPGKTATIDDSVSAGSVIVGSGARVEARSLEKVSERIVVANNATLIAPNLSECGELVVGAGAEVVAPGLAHAESVVVGFQVNVDKDGRCVGGWYGGRSDAGVSSGDKSARVEAQSLERVSGSVLMGDGAKMVAPALRSCGSRVGDGAKLDAPCATTSRPGTTWSSTRTEFSYCF